MLVKHGSKEYEPQAKQENTADNPRVQGRIRHPVKACNRCLLAIGQLGKLNAMCLRGLHERQRRHVLILATVILGRPPADPEAPFGP